jgi:hypothetical protein
MDPTSDKFKEFHPPGMIAINDFFTAKRFKEYFNDKKALIKLQLRVTCFRFFLCFLCLLDSNPSNHPFHCPFYVLSQALPRLRYPQLPEQPPSPSTTPLFEEHQQPQHRQIPQLSLLATQRKVKIPNLCITEIVPFCR